MEREQMWEWIRRRDAVLARFREPHADPVAARPNPDQEALRIVQARPAAASGSRDFPAAEGVVFGVRGGMHPGMMSFGEEFHLRGHAWVISSHLEHGKRKRTLVVNAVRKDALRALFDEGVYVSPQDRRDAADKAREQAGMELILTYGLTSEAYAAAGELAMKRVEAGRVAPEHLNEEISRSLRYAADLVQCADQWRCSDPLRPDNTTSRAIFERLTGARLPKTLSATRTMLLGEPPAGFERGRLAAAPPSRDAVACVCVAFTRHLSNVSSDADGCRHLRDHYVRKGIAGGLVLADAVLSSYAERAGSDADLEEAHAAVRAMGEAVAGVEAEGFTPDACDLAHQILTVEGDRMRLALAGHAPAFPAAPGR